MENVNKIGYFTKLKSFIVQSKRVWIVLRKPTMDEFKGVAKISAIAILCLGAVGFLISDLVKIVENFF